MAKNKFDLQDLLTSLNALTHEDLLTLKEAVRQEWADRLQKAENDAKLLNGEKK